MYCDEWQSDKTCRWCKVLYCASTNKVDEEESLTGNNIDGRGAIFLAHVTVNNGELYLLKVWCDVKELASGIFTRS